MMKLVKEPSSPFPSNVAVKRADLQSPDHVIFFVCVSVCLHGNRSLFQDGEFLFHFDCVSHCLLLANFVTGLLSLFQYTEEQGRRLGVAGWVKNTSRGTVIGQVQGSAPKVEEMSVQTNFSPN